MIAPRTLFGKLLLLFLGFGAAMTGVFIFVMSVEHERYHRQFDQLVNRRLAAEYVASDLLAAKPLLNQAALVGALRHIASINPNVDLYVLDVRGGILAASLPAAKAVRARVDVRPISAFLRGRTRFPLLDDDPASRSRRVVFSAAPLSIGGSAAAYLYVVLDRRDSSALAGRLQTLYDVGEDAGIVLIAALLAFLASVEFLRMLTRRLSALQEDMRRFRDERLAGRPCGRLAGAPLPDDEIGRLRGEFVKFTECIREQVSELEKADRTRREFLASVSHDLCTPLTTLQLQLETLALEGDLAAEVRREYLEVALEQARRLARLTDQLLELAKLEGRQAAYAPEPFQVGELVQDVVLAHERVAREIKVTLAVPRESGDVPLVVGDIALIDRVLGILLENAVRHAGAEGRVAVSLDTGPERVRISVHDTGAGIPESERHRVFDRFYRGDKARSTRTGHAGLGLAIAREILDLHGQPIGFVSGPGEGTTFFFDLPIAGAGVAPPSPRAVRAPSGALAG